MLRSRSGAASKRRSTSAPAEMAEVEGDATPTHSDFEDTDDERQPEDDASDDDAALEDDAMEEDAAEDDGAGTDVVAEYEAAAAVPGAPRAAHEALMVCLRAVRAGTGTARWRSAQKQAWARFAERHALTPDEWLARARDLDDSSDVILALATSALPREATLWLALARAKLNETVAAGAKVLDEACVHAARDASGGLGRVFDAARALADDTGDADRRDALYEQELSAPLRADQAQAVFDRAVLEAPARKALFGAAKAKGGAAFETRRKLETAVKNEERWLAYVALEEDDNERASIVCERALEQCSTSLRLWRQRLSLARTPGDALEVAKRAVEALPDDFRLREAHCRCVERCRLALEALDDAFERAAAACPTEKAPALALGRLAAERRRKDGAPAEAWALALLERKGAVDKAAYAIKAYATRLCEDPKQAWRDLLADPTIGASAKAWRDAAQAALERSDVDEARRLHRTHASKRAERLKSAHATPVQRKHASDAATAWLVFERDAGSLADFDVAYAKAEAWGVFDGAASTPVRARAAAAPVAAPAPVSAPVAKRARAAVPAAPAPAAPPPKRAKKAAAAPVPAFVAPAVPRVEPAAAADAPADSGENAAPPPRPRRVGGGPPPPPKKGPSDDAKRLARTAFLVGLKGGATTEAELRTAFGPCGAISQTRVLRDKRSGAPTGKGFVEFAEDDGARGKALKLGKEERRALGGDKPVSVFASKYLCPAAPVAAPPRPRRAPSGPLVPRAVRRPQQARRPGRLGVGAPAPAAAPVAPPPAGGHSQDAFRSMFMGGGK